MTIAKEMHPVYCRECGALRMEHINPPLKCLICKGTDFAYLVATTDGGGDVVFYAEVPRHDSSESSKEKR